MVAAGDGDVVGVEAGMWWSVNVGQAPDYGWGEARLSAGGTADVTVAIGGRMPIPVDLTVGDGPVYFLDGYGNVYGALDYGCAVFCGSYQADFEYRGDAVIGQAGRELTLGPTVSAQGAVTRRRVYVPPSGRFARTIEATRLPVYALGGLVPADLDAALDHGAQGIAMRRAAWT